MREFVDKIIREPFKTSHVTGPVLTRCLFEGHPAWLRSNAQTQAAPNSMQCESFICFKWVENNNNNNNNKKIRHWTEKNTLQNSWELWEYPKVQPRSRPDLPSCYRLSTQWRGPSMNPSIPPIPQEALEYLEVGSQVFVKHFHLEVGSFKNPALSIPFLHLNFRQRCSTGWIWN